MEPNGIGQAGFELGHRIGMLAAGACLFILVFELVRRGYLKERYALLWLAAAGASLLIGLFPQAIAQLSLLLRIQYLTFFYVVSFVFLLMIVLVFTVVISRLSERTRELAQRLALLQQQLEELKPHEPPAETR